MDHKPMERYESKGGKHWVEVFQTPDGKWAYKSNSGGGSGLYYFQIMNRISEGYFLPDGAKTPMVKVERG